jgi:hypothetical protein
VEEAELDAMARVDTKPKKSKKVRETGQVEEQEQES